MLRAPSICRPTTIVAGGRSARRRRSPRSSAASARSSTTIRSTATSSITPGPQLPLGRQGLRLSGEVVYDLGGAELTSITAYRYNKYMRGQDADFNNLDILYRDDDGGSSTASRPSPRNCGFRASVRRPARLAGRRLLRQREAAGRRQSRYGDDYDRYANCLVAANFGRPAPDQPALSTRLRRPASIRSSPARLPFVGASATALPLRAASDRLRRRWR